MYFYNQNVRVLEVAARSALNVASWILSTALLWGGTAKAQVNLSPIKIEINSNRGQAQGVINITNSSNETFRARVYAEAFTYHRDLGFQVLPSTPTDLRPYLQFSPRELIVPAGTTRRIRLNARLTPNLPDGEYRAMIFTEPLKANTVNDGRGNATRIITRVGAALFVRKGDVRPNLLVENTRLDSTTKQIHLLVRNNGNASVYPSVKWTLRQGDRVIKTGELVSVGIVPQSERNLILNSTKKDELNLTTGKYKLSGELIWGEDNKNKTPFKFDVNVPAQNRASSLTNSKI
jgi:P pilus assembly chaperone PapD